MKGWAAEPSECIRARVQSREKVGREAMQGADLAIFVTSLDLNDTHVETGSVQKLNINVVLQGDAIKVITDASETHLGF